MNISRIDLNLRVYLDALLRKRNVTRAADQLGITPPAIKNSDRLLPVMASNYTKSTIIPGLLDELRSKAAGISLDILPPSDVTIQDVEKSKVDWSLHLFGPAKPVWG